MEELNIFTFCINYGKYSIHKSFRKAVQLRESNRDKFTMTKIPFGGILRTSKLSISMATKKIMAQNIQLVYVHMVI